MIPPLVPSLLSASARPASAGPTFAEHLRKVNTAAAGTGEIPFGQYLQEVNHVDRRAVWAAELGAAMRPASGRVDPRPRLALEGDEQRRSLLGTPRSPEVVERTRLVTVYQPPVVLSRGFRVDVLA